MAARYRFPAWVREHVGSTRPCEVKRHFEERGVDYSDEFWRNLLRSKPPVSFRIATWGPICDAAGVSLSAFFEWEPGETPPRRVKRNRPSRPTNAKKARQPAAPPRPADYFGDGRV